MRRPDFFIVGAPKSGTTALHQYLREHPQVFLPGGSGRHKEPHYFCPDLYSPRYIHDEQQYLSLFDDAGAASRVGEASVYYLYSQEAARRIAAFAPDAAILVMLRNPTQMIYSLHSQRLYSGHEDIADFAEALAVEEDRRQGRRLPPHPHPIPVLFYRQMGRYAAQVERYIEVFGRERVHVVLHDDLVADVAAAYSGVCSFLGVDPGHRPDFEIVNPNKQIRSTALRDALKFSERVKALTRRIVPKSIRPRLAARIHSWNTVVSPRTAMPRDLQRTLQAEFAPDVERLGELIGRDLAHWSRPQG